MPVSRTLARSGTEVISRMLAAPETGTHRPRGVLLQNVGVAPPPVGISPHSLAEHFRAREPCSISIPAVRETGVDERAQTGRCDGRYVRPDPPRPPRGRQRGGAHLRPRRGHLRAHGPALPEER